MVSPIKRGAVCAAQVLGVFVAMLIAFVVSAMVISTGVTMPPAEASQAGVALLVVAFVNALVLGYLIWRARWTGIKLIAAIVVIQFGVETFMTQIETLYFNYAIAMPLDTLWRIIGVGFLRALIFVPLAVLVLGKFKGTPSAEKSLAMPPREWVKWVALLAIVYAAIYFLFGYFVAWQWAEARQFYSGTTAIKPFLTHIVDTWRVDPILPLFQILRGAMWAGLALFIVNLVKTPTWETCLAVAFTFAVILASAVIFPNPFMPAMVRQAHFFELASSMLTFGAIAGWVWSTQLKRTE